MKESTIVPCRRNPCSNCPFRSDLPANKGWLGKKEATEIIQYESVIYHKTVGDLDRGRLQCAGHMILRKDKNVFYRFAKYLGILPKLSGIGTVVKTAKEFVELHSK